jgi:site-specific DNA recombinase
MKVIIYARKSSESDDRQVQSIDDQFRILEDLAAKNQWLVVQRISDSKTAKEPYVREGFTRMMAMLQRKEAEAILVWNLNRLTRNPVDSGAVQWMLQEKVIKAIYTPEKAYLSEDNVLLFKVETGVSEQFIIDLRKVTQRGMDSKIEKGWYPGLAPEGYINDEQVIKKDPERFPLIEWAFKEMAGGLTSINKLVESLNAKGYQTRTTKHRAGGGMSDSTLTRILHNPFYAGWFQWRGQLFEGAHEPMVSWDTFVDVQKSLATKGKPKPKTTQFVFKGDFTCGVCGRAVTAERQKGHVYYHCAGWNKCKQRSIREEKVEAYLDGMFSKLEFPPSVADELNRIVGTWYENDAGFAQGILEAQNRQSEELQKRLSTILSLLTKNLLDEEDFEREHKEMKEKLTKIKIEQQSTLHALDRARETTLRVFELSRTARQMLGGGSDKDRMLLLAELGVSLVLKDGQVEGALNPLFEPFITGSSNTKTPSFDESVSAWGTRWVNVRTAYQVWELALSGLRLRSVASRT